MALLVVLLLLSITLGLSYAAVRTQSTEMMIQRNAERRQSAREVAMTAMSMAIKKMHTDQWDGADTTLVGSLGTYENYQVRYITGDPSLSSGDPDYEEYPYRVTLLATGYAAAPDVPSSIATYQIRTVVRLVCRALADEPNGWNDLTEHTVCQWSDGDFVINCPSHIEGDVRVRGTMYLREDLPWASEPRYMYLLHLKTLAQDYGIDWRPFSGSVKLPHSRQWFDTCTLLQGILGVSAPDTAATTGFSWQSLNTLSSYRLYPGGKEYVAPKLAQDLRNMTLRPDPKTNPLGLFIRTGEAQIHENVTIEGTLVTQGASVEDVEIIGTNVRLLSHELPSLEGEDRPVCLPLVVSADDLTFHETAEVTATGLLIAKDDFDVFQGPQDSISVSIDGHVAGRDFAVLPRSEWVHSDWWWGERWDEFEFQLSGFGATTSFPVWLKKYYGLDSEPKITIEPDRSAVRYHWHNPDNPVYVPHADDDGLRWELIEWTENP